MQSSDRLPIDHTMFLQARRYHICAHHLSKVDSGLKIGIVHAPVLHLSYLSSEIYLKLLCYKMIGEKYPKMTHNLKKIFDQLKPHARAKIRKKFKPELVRILSSIETIPDLPDRPHPATPASLEEALAMGVEYFESFRYSWEGYPNSTYAIDNLPNILKAVTLELYPEFKKYDK